ncbi:hypothetical protein ABK040_012491 [Willaertia magna]
MSTTIAEAKEDNHSINNKKALIIYNAKLEPEIFQNCIEQKLTSFVKKDFQLPSLTLQTSHLKPFLSKLDKIPCGLLGNGEILDNYDIIFTTLYAQNLSNYCITKLKNLIETKRIAIVFLRGDKKCIPYQLGYSTNSFINWTYGKEFRLNFENVTKIIDKSSIFKDFYFKNNKIINQFNSKYIMNKILN